LLTPLSAARDAVALEVLVKRPRLGLIGNGGGGDALVGGTPGNGGSCGLLFGSDRAAGVNVL
jgi:hypothetical protein